MAFVGSGAGAQAYGGVDVAGKVVPLAYDVPGPNRWDGVERGRRFSMWIDPLGV